MERNLLPYPKFFNTKKNQKRPKISHQVLQANVLLNKEKYIKCTLYISWCIAIIKRDRTHRKLCGSLKRWPKTLQKLQRFLRLANYIWKWIANICKKNTSKNIENLSKKILIIKRFIIRSQMTKGPGAILIQFDV